MLFRVTVKVGPPADLPMDPLRQEGAVSFLGSAISEIADSLDDDAWQDEWWTSSYDSGVPAVIAIAGKTASDAAEYARGVVQSALAHIEHLRDWEIISCDADPADDGASDTTEAPAQQSTDSVEVDDVDWSSWISDHADHLRAFNHDLVSDDEATTQLAAGALIFASSVTVDQLFRDLEQLSERGGTVADGGVYFVLEELPGRFAHRYDVRFARHLLVATIIVASRLTRRSWTSPASVAEALALHIIVEAARTILEEHELIGEDLDNLYRGFDDAAFDDVDHEWLYEMSMDGFEDDEDLQSRLRFTDMRFDAWFDQRPMSGSFVDPYALDITPR
jgi:hypothetical protein